MSPKSDKNGNNYGPSTESSPGSDINVKEFELTKELFDKVMALNNTSFDANKVDWEEHVPYNSSRYPNVANASLYMSPPSSYNPSSSLFEKDFRLLSVRRWSDNTAVV